MENALAHSPAEMVTLPRSLRTGESAGSVAELPMIRRERVWRGPFFQPQKSPKRTSGQPDRSAVRKPSQPSLARFVVVSLLLHGVALGTGAVWYASFRGPELTLAQGALSLEILNESPGQNGSAVSLGEGATSHRKPSTVKTHREKESPTEVTEPVKNPAPVVAKNEEVATETWEEVSNTDETVPLEKSRKTAAESKTAAASNSAPVTADTATTEKGHAKKAAMSGSSAPSTFQPGSPGGVAASTVSNPTPPYPEKARRGGVEGVVVLRLNINAEGRVRQATVVRSSGRGDFDQAAIHTIEQRWRYRPATSWGHAVESVEVVRICFVLGDA